MEHISKYWLYWGARRFGLIWIASDQPSMYDHRFTKYRNTAVGAQTRRWRHFGGIGSIILRFMHWSVDSPFVPCSDDVDYKRRFGSIVEGHRALADFLQRGLQTLSGYTSLTLVVFNYQLATLGERYGSLVLDPVYQEWAVHIRMTQCWIFCFEACSAAQYYVKIPSTGWTISNEASNWLFRLPQFLRTILASSLPMTAVCRLNLEYCQ